VYCRTKIKQTIKKCSNSTVYHIAEEDEKTTPELHDVTTLPDPDVQIIEEKS